MDAFISVDKKGRMVLPKKIREAAGNAEKFAVHVTDEKRIEFTPILSIKEMHGFLKGSLEDYFKDHAKED